MSQNFAALLYLDQYQNGLLEAEVTTLREQARIFAGALSEASVREESPDSPRLAPDLARPLLRGLTDPTPNAQARLFSPEGEILADTRVREGAGGAVTIEPLQPALNRGRLASLVGQVYDDLLSLLPHQAEVSLLDIGQQPAGADWSPDVREELKGRATLILAKQRNGPTGDIELTFLSQYTRFEDRAKVDTNDAAEAEAHAHFEAERARVRADK